MTSIISLNPPDLYLEEPPPYSAVDERLQPLATSHNTQSSSSESLLPSEVVNDPRRKLLLVYVHGFLGSETSFQNFPAHVHNLVSTILVDSHVVHTKIYPRYRSRKAVQIAAQEFSVWLAPNELPTTDVILLGHSMGGIMAADVVLLPPENPLDQSPLRHHIIGTVNFDTPFLGMHPGIISSGISSLFRSPPVAPARSLADLGTLAGPQSSNSRIATTPSTLEFANASNYNTPFANDIRSPDRSGWASALHFITKHSGNLGQATKELIASHVEFGSCMADLEGLKLRYCHIRMLDERNADSRKSVVAGSRPIERVRFVNYYTASTGRPKQARAPQMNNSEPTTSRTSTTSADGRAQSMSSRQTSISPAPSLASPEASSVGISANKTLQDSKIASNPEQPYFSSATDELAVEDDLDDLVLTDPESDLETTHSELDELDPTPYFKDVPDLETPTAAPEAAPPSYSAEPTEPAQASVPSPCLPDQPPRLTDGLDDKAAIKSAIKEHKQSLKIYRRQLKETIKSEHEQFKKERKQAVKARKEEIKLKLDARKEDRRRALDTLKEDEKWAMEEQKRREELLEEERKTIQEAAKEEKKQAEQLAKNERENSKQKDRTFCMLPPKDASRNRDPAWIRIFMEGVDEVGAHCGMFFPVSEGEAALERERHVVSENGDIWSERYAHLVTHVAGTIESWVHESIIERAVEQAVDL